MWPIKAPSDGGRDGRRFTQSREREREHKHDWS